MRRTPPRYAPIAFAGLLALAVAPAGHAGDPVPDVDVILEQIPGGSIRFDAPSGGPFDEVVLSGLPRDAARELRPGDLPAGWELARRGRRFVVGGPAVVPPVRLRLSLGEAALPRSLSYEVRRAGEVLLRRDGVVPRVVEGPRARGSLAGVVQLPPQVSPGETVAFRALETAELPPGGRFVLSGVVAEPFPADEWEDIPYAIVNTTRSHLKVRHAALPRDFELQGDPGACAELAPLAAVLAAAGGLGAGGAIPVARVAEEGAGQERWAVREARSYQTLSNASKSRHDTAMNAIRNIRALIAVAPAGGADPVAAGRGRAGLASGGGAVEVWRVAAPGAAVPSTVAWSAGEELALADDRVQVFALTGEPTGAGCRFGFRDPSWAEVATALGRPADRRAAVPPPAGSLSGTVFVADVPADVEPGTPLSLQYLDLFGDVWLDVPAVPGVEVVPPPRVAADDAPPPCVHAATPYLQAGELLCVCGTFPSPEAWQGLALGDRPLGTPVSASSRTVWVRLPEGTGLGRQEVAGSGAAGFAADCRAATQVVAIGGELDSERLLRGETTPMRLTVSGSEDRLPLRLRNRTPAIIEIEGGGDQVVETSGGGDNTVTRQVSGLAPGSFDVEWVVEVPSCPCAEGDAPVW